MQNSGNSIAIKGVGKICTNSANVGDQYRKCRNILRKDLSPGKRPWRKC